jgi:2-dehydropantoate 2-reductase
LSRAKPHWHIIGAGSIGCLFADALLRGGYEVTLVLRPGSDTGCLPLVVERDTGRSEHPVNTTTPERCESIRHLLVTTKAYDVHGAVSSVAAAVSDEGAVVLLANGMGFTEQLQDDWPELDVFCGTTTEGAYRVGPRHIRHAGTGETLIGRAGMPIQPAWFAPLARAVDNCLWDRHIETALWMKLAVNCIINPVTALHGCRNGELASNASLATEVACLGDEVARICRAAGFAAVAADLADAVHDVIVGTANNRSSMLQDVQAGRRTEIDYINGYLLQVARRHGVDAPHNRALVERIVQSGN